MPSLPELQRAFARALVSADARECAVFVVAGGLEPEERLQIYRNNSRATFLATLQADFPAIERLVGAEYFRSLVSEYREAHPSPSGNLHHAGERFADYLERRFAGTPYEYFSDVARLEWARQEAMVARDAPSFDLTRLAEVPAARYADLVLQFHPSARIVSSPYPVLRIWKAQQTESEPEVIDLASAGENVLVLRAGADVELHALDPASLDFLTGVARGAPLAELAASAQRGGVDLGALLQRFVAAQAIIAFELSAARGRTGEAP